MLYVQSRKSFKVRREKKLISLPSAKKTLGKELVCRVSIKTLGKPCRVFFLHSANPIFAEYNYFAECFSHSTQQRACLPSARRIALGKPPCTQQTDCFR